LRKLKRRCCYEHAKATLSKIEDPRKALAFHKKWCERRKRAAHTDLGAEDLATSLFPEEEEDLPQQAEARQRLHEHLDALRDLPSSLPPIDTAELLEALREIKSRSCPGEDAVPVAALKMAVEREPLIFCAIFSAFIRHRSVPQRLKRGYVVTLLRGGGRPPWEPKSWRPIAVSTALARLFDRLLFRRANSNRSSSRHGQKGSVGGIFVDIEGAVEKCSTWPALKVRLERDVRSDYLLLLRDYLSSREITLQHGSDRCSRALTRGTPQGGVTSPWIFNAFMLTFEAPRNGPLT
ncbi:hypothetical protein FOZ63_000428, partial [Perkinsus olseni]